MITRFYLTTLVLLSLSAVVHAEEVALSADYLEGWWSLDGKEGCNVIDTRYVLFRDNGTVESGRGTVPNGVGEWSVGPLSDTDAAPDSLAETSLPGTAVGVTAFADDPDVMDTVSYSLDNDAGGRFAIDPGTGVMPESGSRSRVRHQ